MEVWQTSATPGCKAPHETCWQHVGVFQEGAGPSDAKSIEKVCRDQGTVLRNFHTAVLFLQIGVVGVNTFRRQADDQFGHRLPS